MDQSIIKWKENVTEKQLHLLAFILITLRCGWKQIRFQHLAVEDIEQVEKNKLLVLLAWTVTQNPEFLTC